jgi:hypothetical protein
MVYLILSVDYVELIPDRSTLVLKALERTLLDSALLVQRSSLELINLHFPLHLK